MIQTIGSSARALGRTSNGWTQSPRTWERQFAEEEYAHTEALLVLAQAIEEARRTHCCPIAYPAGESMPPTKAASRPRSAHNGEVRPEDPIMPPIPARVNQRSGPMRSRLLSPLITLILLFCLAGATGLNTLPDTGNGFSLPRAAA
jgi:hypothetical protein